MALKTPLTLGQGVLKGEYHCIIDLLYDWFGISCMTTDNFCLYLQNRLIQTSQTGGQWYTDTSLFSIPWLGPGVGLDYGMFACSTINFIRIVFFRLVEHSLKSTFYSGCFSA